MRDFNIIESNDGATIVCEAIRSLRDIAQCCEEQRTRRYEISKKCALAVKAIDSNTAILNNVIAVGREERMKLLDDLEKIFMLPSIDDNQLRLAERLFDHLERTSAIVALKSAPQMPMLY